jgi:hypothetical protein
MSADSLQEGHSENDEDASAIPYSSVIDYVASHPPTCIPPRQLTVKVGGMYRIMRNCNFSVELGLVKNARVVVTDIGAPLVSVCLLRNCLSAEQEDILLPCITFMSRLPSTKVSYSVWFKRSTERIHCSRSDGSVELHRTPTGLVA